MLNQQEQECRTLRKIRLIHNALGCPVPMVYLVTFIQKRYNVDATIWNDTVKSVVNMSYLLLELQGLAKKISWSFPNSMASEIIQIYLRIIDS